MNQNNYIRSFFHPKETNTNIIQSEPFLNINEGRENSQMTLYKKLIIKKPFN